MRGEGGLGLRISIAGGAGGSVVLGMHTERTRPVGLDSSRGRASEVATSLLSNTHDRKSGRLGLAGLLSLGLLASCRTPAHPGGYRAPRLNPDGAGSGVPVERESQGDVQESYKVLEVESRFEVVIARQTPVTVPKLGAVLADLTPEVAAARGVTPFSGVLIKELVKDGAAVQAGLRGDVPGDVVMAKTLDGAPVVSVKQVVADLRAKKKAGDSVVLQTADRRRSMSH